MISKGQRRTSCLCLLLRFVSPLVSPIYRLCLTSRPRNSKFCTFFLSLSPLPAVHGILPQHTGTGYRISSGDVAALQRASRRIHPRPHPRKSNATWRSPTLLCTHASTTRDTPRPSAPFAFANRLQIPAVLSLSRYQMSSSLRMREEAWDDGQPGF